MINKIFRYIKIYLLIKYNKLKINYMNTLLINIKHPKLRIGRNLTLKLNENSRLFTSSNEIYDNVNIELNNNSILNLRKASWLGSNVTLSVNNITLGKYSGIHAFGTVIGDVVIGDYVMIAKNVFISSGKHHYDKSPYLPIGMQDLLYEKENDSFSSPVVIDDDVWIGVNCTIMSGITIGKGSIVGSNSVVTKDILPYTIVAGSPAKKIKERLFFNPPKSINASNKLDYPYFYSGFNIEKEPFVVLEQPKYLSATSLFNVSLNQDKEKYISLEVRALSNNLELKYKNQIKNVNMDFEIITFDLDIIKESLFTFKSNDLLYVLDKYDFEVKKIWIH